MDVIMVVSFVEPVANLVWIYGRPFDAQNSYVSVTLSSVCFMVVRILVWVMMHVVKRLLIAVEKGDQGSTANLGETCHALAFALQPFRPRSA